MAIHLITGVPGAGKSLRAVWSCVNRIKTEKEQDRPVFGNVRNFRRQSPLPGSRYQNAQGEFQDISGTWMDCPDGSIIVIDEVQERWRRYRATGEPPPEIAALERHRHRNIDFILTCQNPKQLSDDVRSLVDVHEHLTIKGKGSATVYMWKGRCSTSPYTNRRDADCEVSFWRFPKWVFSEYLSAESHTINHKFPRVFKIGIAMVFIIPLSFWYAFSTMTNLFPESEVLDDTANVSTSSPAPSAPSPAPPIPVEYATAQGYMADDSRCSLFDANGRRINTSRNDCLNTVEMGLPREVPLLNF